MDPRARGGCRVRSRRAVRLVVRHVGVVGYTLGGGMGSLGRKHGFSADHVRTVEIVTADGRLHRVCAENEPELFWAVRGGKGNLGIVTALEIELLPVKTLVAGGIFFAGADAPAVLHAFREVGAHHAGGGQHVRRDHAAAGHGGAAAAAARADRRPPAVRLLRRRPRPATRWWSR